MRTCLPTLSLALVLLGPMIARPAIGDVFVQGTSILSLAIATTPGCMDNQGGGGFTQAIASCAAQGYAAAASAAADAVASTSGGSVSVFAEGSASSVGGGGSQSASGDATAVSTITWQMDADTHYSVSTVMTTEPGAATAIFSDDISGPFPPSGIVPAGFYTLRGNASVVTRAQDVNGAETVSAGPFVASAEVAFAAVGSPTLVLGTISAAGSGAPGLLVEALVGQSVVASTTTGDDGTYLLPDIPGAVSVRVSDPTGALPTQQSGPVVPPATADFVILAAAVPSLSGPLACALVLGLIGSALRSRALAG